MQNRDIFTVRIFICTTDVGQRLPPPASFFESAMVTVPTEPDQGFYLNKDPDPGGKTIVGPDPNHPFRSTKR